MLLALTALTNLLIVVVFIYLSECFRRIKHEKMSLSALLESISCIPNVLVQRKISALVGSIVADAASLHLEWVYDQVIN
jgi:hypothetical protein